LGGVRLEDWWKGAVVGKIWCAVAALAVELVVLGWLVVDAVAGWLGSGVLPP